MSKVVIAAGDVSDEALQYLRSHGAVIDGALGLTMIELPEDAEICKPGYQSPPSEYGIQWADEDGSDPLEWIEVYLNLDVNETRVRLRRARQEEKRCKCNGGLEGSPDGDRCYTCYSWDEMAGHARCTERTATNACI